MGKAHGAVIVFICIQCFASDPGCEGRIREVVEFGGVESIPQLEAINTDRSDSLVRYSSGMTVQQQLKQRATFGFVAIRDEKFAGFIIAQRKDNYFVILSIAVARDVEGQGVGRDLVEKLIAVAKQTSGVDEVRMLVAADDEKSRAFFSHLGLEQGDYIPGRFNAHRVSGLFYKSKFRAAMLAATPPMQRVAPKPQVRPVAMQLETIPISFEELRKLDPTLEHARD